MAERIGVDATVERLPIVVVAADDPCTTCGSFYVAIGSVFITVGDSERVVSCRVCEACGTPA